MLISGLGSNYLIANTNTAVSLIKLQIQILGLKMYFTYIAITLKYTYIHVVE